MTTPGFVSHIARNRRLIWSFIASYLLAFNVLAAVAGVIFIGIFDPANTVITNPIGYLTNYGLIVFGLTLVLFGYVYFTLLDNISRRLKIRVTSKLDERRFVSIAETQCIAAGIRQPQFGIIEVPQINALSIGEGPSRGMIVVTRGLLDHLDDDELAAVIAHETAHIRFGDTRVLGVNYALMRTAVKLQVRNPLRLEDWRQLVLPLIFPPFLLLLVGGSMFTWMSIQCAREARRCLNLSRDHIADAEAIRLTHNPDALLSAMKKMSGRGRFKGSERFDDMLFEGDAEASGGTHPSLHSRIEAINDLSGSMLDPARIRRDTRKKLEPSTPQTAGNAQPAPFGGIAALAPAVATFGKRGLVPAVAAAAATGAVLGKAGGSPWVAAKPLTSAIPLPQSVVPEEPERPIELKGFEPLALWWHDNEAYHAHMTNFEDYYEWRDTDGRNALGMRPEMAILVTAVTALLLFMHWPADGNFGKFARTFSPNLFGEMS
ncbi:M48 family metalloprotease [Altererythrobacter sp. ZODW24]|uniref:M48 family metalloprotease n=1 Tax=Altererythrobacter sp. ZODW24 TaxID=2185142 RepID=UPI000DF7BA9E|nr:M48 family metalloprotease [Altererythrobacter sp. ZODW24]